ncbi:tetratricopeptide repeat protein 38-like [Antedon mediterranea]|uniref:tetratricopeptide repeat protein 38-like n=1 Tax=Antedon mediterranea TaxID=105859 RepID=UPI003AF46A3E
MRDEDVKLRAFCGLFHSKVMSRRCNWRDCQAWKDEGLEFSTTSNEACKLYDAALTQIVGYYQDKSMGGIDQTFKGLKEADPEFVMGHVLTTSLTLCSMSIDIKKDEQLQKSLDYLVTLKKKPTTTHRETKHIEAVQVLADGWVYCKANFM